MYKKLFKLFLIFVTYLLIVRGSFAYEFKKSEANPLKVTYINNYAYELQHHIFKEGNLYKGIFVINRPPESYYSLGYFESTDGINWQMKKEIMNTGTDLSNPSILRTANGYIIFVTRYDNNTIYKIYSSSCDFDFNCSSNLSPAIMPDANNYSEQKGVFAGHPFKQGERTYLFFGAWGGDGFKIKMAYSDDLITWQKCPNRFLYGGDGPFPYQEGDDLYLFFHQSNSSGIKFAKTTLPLTCESLFLDQGYLLTRDQNYDQKHLIFPSVINDDGILKLYYSGRDSSWNWNLDLACAGQSCLITTPTPTPLTPIIIIPGTFASWNKDAILHSINKPQSDWKINPFVNEYKGIIETLKNLGYEENKNLFIFAYDWRKPVLEIVDDLKSYIEKLQTTTTNFQIVGHSLGGLIGRIYGQKYNNQNIDKLITVGSPHRGVSQYYSVVEAGEIERFNNYFWLAVKLVSIINKNTFETDKETLNRLFPMMKDLFPAYNFLKKDGVEVDISDMKIKNVLLSNEPYKINESNLTNLTSILGEKGNTLKGYNVINQTFTDKLLGNYLDGRPQSSFFEIGDYTVLSSSATVSNSEKLNLEHGELIYKKDGIKKILDRLYIQYSDPQIVEGQGTTINSSLIFLIKSPATLEVIYNGQTYFEQDGMIFIENAQSGDYELKAKGKEKGRYTIVVGQIGKEKDLWSEINGEITSDSPTSQIDNYNFNFNNIFPKPIDNPLSLVDEIITDLNNFNTYKIAEVNYVKNDLKSAKKYLQSNDLKKLNSVLLLVHSRLMIIRDKIKDENNKKTTLTIIEKLEKLFIITLQDYLPDQKTINAIKIQSIGYKKNISDQSSKIISLQNSGKDVSKQLLLINQINSRFLSVSDYLKYNKYSNAQIILKTISYLIAEVKKL